MKEKEIFCNVCDEFQDFDLKSTSILHKIKDEEIRIEVDIPHCKACGSQLFDIDIEETHFKAAHDEFRKRKKLLFPIDIKRIREKYGVSQRAFARALGFAEPTINRYEQGAIQDVIHNNILLLVSDPENMLRLTMQNQDNLSKKEVNLIKENIENLQFGNRDKISDETIFAALNNKIELFSNILEDIRSHVSENTKQLVHLDHKITILAKDRSDKAIQTENSWEDIIQSKHATSPIGRIHANPFLDSIQNHN